MLAYNITNWVEAPGRREARLVVTRQEREKSRRRARERVRHICRALDEPCTLRLERAVDAVVRRLGREKTQELVAQARTIFAGPGMLVQNGSRLRTLGGVFFQLTKSATTPGGSK